MRYKYEGEYMNTDNEVNPSSHVRIVAHLLSIGVMLSKHPQAATHQLCEEITKLGGKKS